MGRAAVRVRRRRQFEKSWREKGKARERKENSVPTREARNEKKQEKQQAARHETEQKEIEEDERHVDGNVELASFRLGKSRREKVGIRAIPETRTYRNLFSKLSNDE